MGSFLSLYLLTCICVRRLLISNSCCVLLNYLICMFLWLILLDFPIKNSYPNTVIDLLPPFLYFFYTLWFRTSNSFFLSNFIKKTTVVTVRALVSSVTLAGMLLMCLH